MQWGAGPVEITPARISVNAKIAAQTTFSQLSRLTQILEITFI
jgi:hypothetical protein